MSGPEEIPPLNPRRWLILAICCSGLLIVSMDNSIVNVALPSIRKSFNASLPSLQWTIDAYLVVIASLLLLSGSTADRLGRRLVFTSGLGVFTAGSLLCSLAPSVDWLIASRMVQAVGGSMLTPVAVAIITNVFPEPKERARAIGAWGATAGIALALGPVVGGALTDSVGWRSIFWINLPIGAAAMALTFAFVPESRAPRARRLDPVGQLLIIAFLGGTTYAIIEGARTSWTDPQIVVCIALAVAAVVGVLIYEPRRRDPLIDLRFFSSVPFSGATVTAVCGFSAFNAFLFLNTLYLQDVRGLSPLEAGLYTLPLAIMALVFSIVSGQLVASTGARRSLLGAGAGMCTGALMLTQLEPSTSAAYLFTAYVIFGIGFGMINAPITNSAVSGMPRSQAGVAAGIASSSRQLGSTLGVAVAGAIVAGSAGTSRFSAATHAAWWVIAAATAVVFVLGWFTTTGWAGDTAAATARKMAAVRQESDAPVRV